MLFSLLCGWCSEILNSTVEHFDAYFLVIIGYSWYYRLQGEGLRRRCFMWLAFRRGSWGPYGEGGEKQGEVLMGKRQMACQCQKWSCAEESAGANEREDGRKGWLINLFTSLKTLQAPFWLKFHLPSIITNAGSGHRSCQHQMLWNTPPPAWAAITLRKIKPSTFGLGFFLICIFIYSSCCAAERLARCNAASVSLQVCFSVTL